MGKLLKPILKFTNFSSALSSLLFILALVFFSFSILVFLLGSFLWFLITSYVDIICSLSIFNHPYFKFLIFLFHWFLDYIYVIVCACVSVWLSLFFCSQWPYVGLWTHVPWKDGLCGRLMKCFSNCEELDWFLSPVCCRHIYYIKRLKFLRTFTFCTYSSPRTTLWLVLS